MLEIPIRISVSNQDQHINYRYPELGARSWIGVPAFLAFKARGPQNAIFLKHAGTQNAKK